MGYQAANGSDLLMIYHAENHLFGTNHSNGIPFYAGIGLARSGDGGITWQREGQILSGHDAQQASQPPTGAGIGTPAAIEANGYIYVFFREIDLQSKMEGIGIARSLISDDAVPGSWQKFLNGSFTSLGLGGAFTPLQLILDKNVPSDHRQPFVTFNTYLNAYVLIVVGNGGIYMSTSPDVVTYALLPAPLGARRGNGTPLADLSGDRFSMLGPQCRRLRQTTYRNSRPRCVSTTNALRG